jgi:hypothetical protein
MPHDWTAKQVRRKGLPVMSQIMMAILYKLRESSQAGYPFIALEGVHHRTINSMLERDWMLESTGLDGVRYKITGRGLHALKVYETPKPRTDGICPRCGICPRTTYDTGTPCAYCEECIQEIGRKRYALKGNQLNPEGMCAQCSERQRHTYPSGHTIPYCMICRKAMRKQEREQKHKNLLKRIEQGEFLPCYRCREKPRYHTEKTVYDYCHGCYREYHNEYSRKWELKRALKKNGISIQEDL